MAQRGADNRDVMRKSARSAKPPKSVVAFKVDPELAALLDAIPNKSEFIRAAVQARLVAACPLCRGSGIAPPNTRDELSRLVADHPLVACVHCGAREPRPCHAPGHCEDDARILAFEKYGLFSCSSCFGDARPCENCTKPFWPSRGSQGRCEQCRKAA